MPKHYEDKFEILLSDSWGIYIPQHFTERFTAADWGIDENSPDWQTLASGPDSEYYWDAWETILDSAKHTDANGVVWSLYQNGDLWAVAWDEMTESEREKFGGDGF